MANISEYSNYDGLGLAELVKRGKVTPAELVDAALEAVGRLNPKINAVILTMEEYAEQIIKSGPPEGPFKGVPFLAKDLTVSYAGIPTDSGSRLLKGWIRDWDSEIVRRYQKAGLVTIGKANTPEVGVGFTEPVLYGPTRNPWKTDHVPGGSSGGSAAAVACGMVPLAHGNDGGGSIRIPASCCGVFGLKPTRGRNPLGPDQGEMWNGLVAEHCLTRTVRDSAAILDCTAGPDVGDPYWAPLPERPFLEEVGRDPGRLRIAFTYQAPSGVPVHQDCKKAVVESAKLLEELGHHVEEAGPEFDARALDNAFGVVLGAHQGAFIEDVAVALGRTPGPDNLEKTNFLTLQRSNQITAKDLVRSLTGLNTASRRIGAFFETYDLLVTPTMTDPPPLVGQFTPEMDDIEAFMAGVMAYVSFTVMFNCTGQPAMSVPLYWSADGLPIGVQFAARYGDEALLFRLAGQLEKARPWIDKRPPIYA